MSLKLCLSFPVSTNYNGQDHLQVDSSLELGASENGIGTKLLLNTEDLVELGKTLGTCWCTGFLGRNVSSERQQEMYLKCLRFARRGDQQQCQQW